MTAQENEKIRHPAKYTNSLLPIFGELIGGDKNLKVLDPMAGTGKIHLLPYNTYGVEIEQEWAILNPKTICADATNLPFLDCFFDVICTSPTYGNRMADCHNAKDASKRNTYTHCLGHKLSDNNTGKMQFGDKYKDTHVLIYKECYRVLKDNGKFIINIKNHIRKGKEVDVFSWHIDTLKNLGFNLKDVKKVYCNGNGFGRNGKLRTGFEYVALLIKELE